MLISLLAALSTGTMASRQPLKQVEEELLFVARPILKPKKEEIRR
jgi:hypothetical protein